MDGSKWVGALGHSPKQTEKTAEESWVAQYLTAHQRWETPFGPPLLMHLKPYN